MSRLIFFATRSDMEPVFEAVEATREVKYLECFYPKIGQSDERIHEYSCARQIEELGKLNISLGQLQRFYAIVPKSCEAKVGYQDIGGVLFPYLSGTLFPESVEVKMGGVFDKKFFVRSEIVSQIKTNESEKLFRAFSLQIAKRFQFKKRGFRFGQEALELLLQGKQRFVSNWIDSPVSLDITADED